MLLIFLLLGGLHRLMRIYQLRRSTPLPNNGEPRLIVVVSAGCPICPAQKNVVAQLRQRYPSLHVETLDAEAQRDRVRELSVMTVPTTLLQAPDGALVNINNGFIALEPLSRQIDGVMRKCL